MTHYIRDVRAKAADPDRIVGACLVKARSFSDVDQWHCCGEVEDLLKQDPRDVIYGESLEEIEAELWKRYPVAGCECTLITRRWEGAWEIERTARLQQEGLAALQNACAMHGKVLVGADLLNRMGGQKALHDHGFLTQARNSRQALLVRFNPRQVAIRDWRGQVDSIRVFLRPELPPELTLQLHEAVRPDRYPDKHPYAGMLSSKQFVTERQQPRWGRWRRKAQDRNLGTAPETILRCVQLADRLGGRRHRHPWRRGPSWKPLLQQAIQYVHGLEGAKDSGWPRLARWLRREARAARMRIPPLKRIPPRPVFRKGPSGGEKSASTNPRKRRP